MTSVEHSLWFWSAILLLAGGIIFWIGAFTPPYKQWTTSDVKEYLSVIGTHKIGWYIIHGCFAIAMILTLVGMNLLSRAIEFHNHPMIAATVNSLFTAGTVFWIADIAFRLTVTLWAAQKFVADGQVMDWYLSFRSWGGLLFGIYMVIGYFAIGCIGVAFRDIALIPNWLSWFNLIFGFSGAVLFLTGFPFFAPPLMIHLPLMLNGIFILIKLKTVQNI